ncbi:MAG TPA: phenylalanine--tRNA ligase subunit alpha, partial [Lachnospiraceae bacterium]|nr:phenylalanine--tRNA ligase subunit alpha [Lachnospiraceae bacterium]
MADLNELSEKLSGIKAEIKEELNKLETSKSVFEYKKAIFDSKAGKVGSLMREMGKIPNEMKAEYGKRVNELKTWAQEKFDEMDEKFKAEEMRLKYESEKLDVTMPGKVSRQGFLHPNTLVRNQIVDIFGSMGFEIFEGTEIETDYYNFTALNTPDDHPARDMQDTFYLSDKFLLRTQTSAGQIHVMEKEQPPIKIISPGKVFRSDDDA